MKYVLDASVAMRWVVPNELTPKALQLLDEFKRNQHEFLAPDTFLPEVANGLTKAERQKLLRVGESIALYGRILNALPTLHAHIPLVLRAISLSSQTRSGFYDCLYVALAEREQCELVTADAKLARNLLTRFPFIRELSSLV